MTARGGGRCNATWSGCDRIAGTYSSLSGASGDGLSPGVHVYPGLQRPCGSRVGSPRALACSRLSLCVRLPPLAEFPRIDVGPRMVLVKQMVVRLVEAVLWPVLGQRRVVVAVFAGILRRPRPSERLQDCPLGFLRLSALEVPSGQIARLVVLACRALARTSKRLRRAWLVLLRLPPLDLLEHLVWPERVLQQPELSKGPVGRVGQSPR